jgi:hypothetical protein
LVHRNTTTPSRPSPKQRFLAGLNNASGAPAVLARLLCGHVANKVDKYRNRSVPRGLASPGRENRTRNENGTELRIRDLVRLIRFPEDDTFLEADDLRYEG